MVGVIVELVTIHANSGFSLLFLFAVSVDIFILGLWLKPSGPPPLP